jgi:group I intron endonuclease
MLDKEVDMFVYMVTNIVNGKRYIGKTVREKVKIRKREHYTAARRGVNTLFCKAIRKYGEYNFKWDVLFTGTLHSELLKKEIEYIKEYNTYCDIGHGYNMTQGGEGCICPTKRTRDKMKQNQIGDKNSFYGHKHSKKSIMTMGHPKGKHPFKGMKHTTETKTKISNTLKGRIVPEDVKTKISNTLKGRVFSEDTIQKFRDANRGENNPMFGHEYTKEELESRSKKKYMVTHINGTKEIVKVLSLWCKENNINYGYFCNRYKNNGKFYKGSYKLDGIKDE